MSNVSSKSLSNNKPRLNTSSMVKKYLQQETDEVYFILFIESYNRKKDKIGLSFFDVTALLLAYIISDKGKYSFKTGQIALISQLNYTNIEKHLFALQNASLLSKSYSTYTMSYEGILYAKKLKDQLRKRKLEVKKLVAVKHDS